MTVDRQMGLVIVTPEGKVRYIFPYDSHFRRRKPRQSSSGCLTMLSEIRAWFIVSIRFTSSWLYLE